MKNLSQKLVDSAEKSQINKSEMGLKLLKKSNHMLQNKYTVAMSYNDDKITITTLQNISSEAKTSMQTKNSDEILK